MTPKRKLQASALDDFFCNGYYVPVTNAKWWTLNKIQNLLKIMLLVRGKAKALYLYNFKFLILLFLNISIVYVWAPFVLEEVLSYDKLHLFFCLDFNDRIINLDWKLGGKICHVRPKNHNFGLRDIPWQFYLHKWSAFTLWGFTLSFHNGSYEHSMWLLHVTV